MLNLIERIGEAIGKFKGIPPSQGVNPSISEEGAKPLLPELRDRIGYTIISGTPLAFALLSAPSKSAEDLNAVAGLLRWYLKDNDGRYPPDKIFQINPRSYGLLITGGYEAASPLLESFLSGLRKKNSKRQICAVQHRAHSIKQ